MTSKHFVDKTKHIVHETNVLPSCNCSIQSNSGNGMGRMWFFLLALIILAAIAYYYFINRNKI